MERELTDRVSAWILGLGAVFGSFRPVAKWGCRPGPPVSYLRTRTPLWRNATGGPRGRRMAI